METFMSASDLSIWLRNAHFVAAPFTFAGLVLVLLGAFAGAKARTTSLGESLFTGGTLVQMATGFWFLSTLAASEQNPILGSPGDAAMLWGAVLAAVLALLIIHRYPVLAAVATLVTLVGMAFTWHREWVISLDPGYPMEALALAPETAMFLSIAMLLSVGLALAAWMFWRLVTELARREVRTV
jgi:hypothetical protein